MGDQNNAISNVETIGDLAVAALHNTINPPSQFIAYVRILLFHYLQSGSMENKPGFCNMQQSIVRAVNEPSRSFPVLWLAKILKHLTSTSLLTMFKRLSIIVF